MWAWGTQWNLLGTDKEPTDSPVLKPSLVEGLENIVNVIAGSSFNFAIDLDGQVFVWGYHSAKSRGQPGFFLAPTALKNLRSIVDVVIDEMNYYAVDNQGQVFLFYTLISSDPLITAYNPILWQKFYPTLSMASSMHHALAVDFEGGLLYWSSSMAISEAQRMDVISPLKTIVAKNNYFLMLDQNSQVFWYAASNPRRPELVLNLLPIEKIAVGFHSSYALDSEGNVWSWGQNQYGELGLGHMRKVLDPSKIESEPGFVAIAAGNFHCLAIDREGEIWGWGLNSLGRLGDLQKGEIVSAPEKLPGFPRLSLPRTQVKNARSSEAPQLKAAL